MDLGIEFPQFDQFKSIRVL